MNRRGLPSMAHRDMTNAERHEVLLRQIETVRPEHDTGGARVLRAALMREVEGL